MAVAKKLIFIQGTPPVSVRRFRSDVPAEMLEVLDQMLAKNPNDRPQTPHDVVRALEPWTRMPIAPPREEPGIRLSPLARGAGPSGGTGTHRAAAAGRTGRSRVARNAACETVITSNRKTVASPAESAPSAPVVRLRLLPFLLGAGALGVVSALLFWQLSR